MSKFTFLSGEQMPPWQCTGPELFQTLHRLAEVGTPAEDIDKYIAYLRENGHLEKFIQEEEAITAKCRSGRWIRVRRPSFIGIDYIKGSDRDICIRNGESHGIFHILDTETELVTDGINDSISKSFIERLEEDPYSVSLYQWNAPRLPYLWREDMQEFEES